MAGRGGFPGVTAKTVASGYLSRRLIGMWSSALFKAVVDGYLLPFDSR